MDPKDHYKYPELVSFFENAIHHLLYVKKVYPKNMFEKKVWKNIPIWKCKWNDVKEYVCKFLNFAHGLMDNQELFRIIFLLKNVTTKEFTEVFIFECQVKDYKARRSGNKVDLAEDLICFCDAINKTVQVNETEDISAQGMGDFTYELQVRVKSPTCVPIIDRTFPWIIHENIPDVPWEKMVPVMKSLDRNESYEMKAYACKAPSALFKLGTIFQRIALNDFPSPHIATFHRKLTSPVQGLTSKAPKPPLSHLSTESVPSVSGRVMEKERKFSSCQKRKNAEGLEDGPPKTPKVSLHCLEAMNLPSHIKSSSEVMELIDFEKSRSPGTVVEPHPQVLIPVPQLMFSVPRMSLTVPHFIQKVPQLEIAVQMAILAPQIPILSTTVHVPDASTANKCVITSENYAATNKNALSSQNVVFINKEMVQDTLSTSKKPATVSGSSKAAPDSNAQNPDIRFIVQKPTTNPIVKKPITSPIVQKPTIGIISQKSIIDPIVSKSIVDTIAPKSTIDPTVQKPSTYPIFQTPTTYPIFQKPTTYPISQKPITYPIVQKPTAYPIFQKTTTYPIVQKPTTYPTSKKLTSYPIGKKPTTYPIGKKLDPFPSINVYATVSSLDKPVTFPKFGKRFKVEESTSYSNSFCSAYDSEKFYDIDTPPHSSSNMSCSLLFGAVNPSSVSDSKKPALICDSKKPALFSDSEKSPFISYSKKPAVISESEKSALIFDSKKPAVISESEKSALIFDSKKPALIFDSDKAAFVSASEKPTFVSSSKKPAMISESEKPALIFDSKKPALVSDLKQSALVSSHEKAAFVSGSEKPAFVSNSEKPAMVSSSEKPTFVSSSEKPALIFDSKKPTLVCDLKKAVSFPDNYISASKTLPSNIQNCASDAESSVANSQVFISFPELSRSPIPVPVLKPQILIRPPQPPVSNAKGDNQSVPVRLSCAQIPVHRSSVPLSRAKVSLVLPQVSSQYNQDSVPLPETSVESPQVIVEFPKFKIFPSNFVTMISEGKAMPHQTTVIKKTTSPIMASAIPKDSEPNDSE